MTAFDVKRVTKGEADLVHKLMAVFGAAFDDDPSYREAPPDDAYLHQILEDDKTIILVATTGNRVVGGLVAYELQKPERRRSEIYIYDLAVSKAYRRQGIATALIEYLKPIARKCGAWVIYVQADRDDQPAIDLYTQVGKREDVLHFDIII